MPKHSQRRSYFVNSHVHGINSFKYTTYSDEMKSAVSCVKDEVIHRLQTGVTNGKKGIALTVESPVYCINYAEINVLRKVPLRQYFGMELEVDGDASKRTSYGVGSGASTVGADTVTNKTRVMSQNMKRMCELLSEKPEFFSNNNKHCARSLCFNHVTILYYLSKNRSHKIDLNPHCDIEISSKDQYNEKNSQTENTPTVVMSFACTKSVRFYKRTVSNNKYDKAVYVSSMEMSDSEMFVLHPCDERVVERRVKKEGQKTKKAKEGVVSQFRHAVSFKSQHVSDEKDSENDSNYAVSISVCFRDVKTSQWYHQHHDTVDAIKSNALKMDSMTEQQTKKQKLIDDKRIELYDKEFRKKMTSELRQFHKSITK